MEEAANRISAAVLEQMQFFRCVDIESVRGVLDYCTIRTLDPQEVLFEPGQFNRTVYFVIAGSLRVHLNSLESEPISILGPGESVGEMSVIDLQPTSAYVVAVDEVRLLSMDEDIIWSLVRSSHAVACNLLFYLTKRLRQADSIISGGISIDQEKCYGHMDALTGLPNREWLYDLMTRHCQRASFSGKPLSLILADVDDFKAINEKFGRTYGDRMLYALAYMMKTHLRPTEIIARVGADDFAILLPNTDMAAARTAAVRLYEKFKASTPLIYWPEGMEKPTISMGVAQLRPGQDAHGLFTETDAALFRARQMGGDSISE